MVLPLASPPPAFVAPPPAAANSAACGPAHLDRCGDTNQLVDKPDFARAVRRFAGPGRASWFHRGGVAEQVLEGLHGPPDAPVEVEPGLLRFSACRAHSCPEKAAAFIGQDGRLRVLAVLDFRCSTRCEDDYSLEVIAPRDDAQRMSALALAWAQAAADADAKAYGQREPPIVRTTLRAPGAR